MILQASYANHPFSLDEGDFEPSPTPEMGADDRRLLAFFQLDLLTGRRQKIACTTRSVELASS
jgi:hypothetical protein